jgi:broad specificity phosphatase PhoE
MTEKDDLEESVNVLSDLTLELAKKECAEHMQGMYEVYETMRQRPLRVKAYQLHSSSSLLENYKVVHFIRHGQGFHNLMADTAKRNGVSWTNFVPSNNNPYMMPELLDSPLTEIGRQQASYLRDNQLRKLDAMTSPELILVSPCCRTLQTASIALQNFIKPASDSTQSSVPIIAHEMIREESGIHICDKRRSRSQISYEFPFIDVSLLINDDPLFQNDRRETKSEVAERIFQFMQWLSTRPEKKIVIVSHSGWLLTAFNAIFECEDPSLQQWFQTGEMRSAKLEFIEQ